MENELKNEESAVVAVKDELTGAFMTPIFLKGKTWKEQALRIFKHQINEIPIWRSNSSDYSLFLLGIFNEETGIIYNYNEIEKIANGRSVLKE